MAKTIEQVMYAHGWEKCLHCGCRRPVKELVEVHWTAGDVEEHGYKCTDGKLCASMCESRWQLSK
jgi:hypothetical protein